MKKINIILMAIALALTLSQCKKNEEQPTVNDNVVTITLNLSNNSGSKVNVNPAMGTVDFESGDKIYVGSGGKYVGFLTHNGTNFSGNITNPTEDQPLQFYFLGNVTPQETLSAGTTEECSVIISDQTEHLPVISCAASYENYVSGVTTYSAHLLNKCALVKFSVTTPSNSPICITGMNNKVIVDFSQNTMTPSMDGEGIIKLPAGAGENVETVRRNCCLPGFFPSLSCRTLHPSMRSLKGNRLTHSILKTEDFWGSAPQCLKFQKMVIGQKELLFPLLFLQLPLEL